MSRRLSRLLRRLAIVLLVLVVLVVAGFTWFLYWPLEGSVDRLETLVPESVDFVYAGSYASLKDNAWIRTNLLDHPVVPSLDDARDLLEEQVARPMRERLEGPINAMIPLGITRFSVEEDVFPSETIVCGRFCEGWGPERGRPLHPKEWLVLTKTTWKPRFVAALKHGFVRRKIGPGVEIEAEGEPGLWRLVLQGVATTETAARSGCGEGFVIPPENLVYLVRVKNVLGFTNSKALARDVVDLGRVEGARSFADRPDFDLTPPPGGVAAAIDVRPLHGYLIRLLEAGGEATGLLDRFLTVRSLDRMNAVLETPSSDQIRARARILYQSSELAPGVRDVYAEPPMDLRSGIARLVPAEDTFAVVLLSTPPLHLMQSVWEEALTQGQRDLVLDNLRRLGRYRTMDEFFRELSERLGSTAAVAVGRISETFDAVEYPDWYSDPEENPDPMPAFAILVSLKQSAEPKEVDQFLAERMPALGFKGEVRRVDYKGITYSRLEIEQKSADYRLATPAYMLVQDTLVLANNESYFRKIVDTIGGAPSLATDATYKATLAALPERAQIGVFLDVEKLFRVPPVVAPGAGPRGLLWDRRNLWVIENKDDREEAIRYRRTLNQRFSDQRRAPTNQEQIEVERQVDEHVEAYRARYPEYLEEYRQNLLNLGRLRSFGAAFAATRDAISADLTLVVQPAGEGGGGASASR